MFLLPVFRRGGLSPRLAGVFCLPSAQTGPGAASAGAPYGGVGGPQVGFSYLVKLDSFSRRALKPGLFSGSLCQHESISLCTLGGHSGAQGMR